MKRMGDICLEYKWGSLKPSTSECTNKTRKKSGETITFALANSHKFSNL